MLYEVKKLNCVHKHPDTALHQGHAHRQENDYQGQVSQKQAEGWAKCLLRD